VTLRPRILLSRKLVAAFVIVTFAAMAVAAHFLFAYVAMTRGAGPDDERADQVSWMFAGFGFGVTLVLLWRLRRREEHRGPLRQRDPRESE